MSQPYPIHPLSDPRAARLEARLALYAQYAALVSDEVAAAWSAEPGTAGALARELAAERQEVAERYAALADWAEQGEPLTPGAFPGVLAGAVTERDHQDAVNRALQARLEALQATGWVPGLVTPTAAPRALGPGAPTTPSALAADEPVDPAIGGLPPAVGGALVVARSRGIGGVLDGRYPGVVAGDAADYVADVPGAAVAAPARVDVRL